MSNLAMLHSKRVQRANRLNNVEHCRLKQQMLSLDLEKTHIVRVTNQDIRLISLTLDYIQSCSGHSLEGLAPESDNEHVRSNVVPCFLYGERLVSRQKRRYSRRQSAMERTEIQKTSESSSRLSTPTKRTKSNDIRPSTVVTKIHQQDWNEWDRCSRASSPESLWTGETTPITKTILKTRSSSAGEKNPIYARDKFRQQSRSTYSIHSLVEQLKAHATMSFAGISESCRRDTPKESKKSQGLSRNAGLSEILNQSRPTLSANVWKSYINHSNTQPMTTTEQKEYTMTLKKKINVSRKERIGEKLKSFLG